MSDIPARLRRVVVLRAGDRCEYCRLAQKGQEATFHIDHILPKVAGGRTAAANLAPLASPVHCARRHDAPPSNPIPTEEWPCFIHVASGGETTFVGKDFVLLG